MNLNPNTSHITSYIVSGYIITLLLFSYNSTLYVMNRLLFFILLLVFLFISLKKEIVITKNSLVFLPFILLVTISNLWAVDFEVSFHRTIGILSYVIPAFIVYLLLYNEVVNINFLINSYIISVIILGISAVYDYFIIGSTRAAGFAENANTYGLITIYFTLLIWPFIKKSLLLKIILLSCVFISVYISGSRKVLLAVGIILLLNLLIQNKIKIKKIKVKYILYPLIVSMVAFFLYFRYLYGEISLENFELDSLNRLVMLEDNSFNTRESMIKVGLYLFKINPLHGYGIDNFRVISSFGTYSHNNFVEVIISTGVLGLLLYYMIYYKLLKISYRNFKENNQFEIYKLTIIFIILMLIMEFAYVSINSTEIWLVLFSLMLFNEKIFSYESSP